MKKEKPNVKEIFEKGTGKKINDYIIEHFVKMLMKYEESLFFKALDVVITRHQVNEFEGPTDFIRYMYAVLKNMKTAIEWESLGQKTEE